MVIRFNFIILLFFLSTLLACITIKRSAVKGSKSYYETFFINENTLQYFIKPIEFFGENSILVDFTFRKIQSDFSEVVMNFSYITKDESNIEEICLAYDGNSYPIDKSNLMFKEKKGKEVIYRYTTKINFIRIENFFMAADQFIRINDEILKPSDNTKKIIHSIRNDIFEFNQGN